MRRLGWIRGGAMLPFVATMALVGPGAWAQGTPIEPAPPPAPPPRSDAPRIVRIPEGTEVRVRLDEQLSSKKSTAGDEFEITLDEPIRLPDGSTFAAGYHGKGQVTEAHKVEMMGKAGELNIRLDYIRIGDVRVHLRGNEGGEGKSMQSTALVLSLLVTPLFLMRHGHDMVYPKGQKITAFVDADTDIPVVVAGSTSEH